MLNILKNGFLIYRRKKIDFVLSLGLKFKCFSKRLFQFYLNLNIEEICFFIHIIKRFRLYGCCFFYECDEK